MSLYENLDYQSREALEKLKKQMKKEDSQDRTSSQIPISFYSDGPET